MGIQIHHQPSNLNRLCPCLHPAMRWNQKRRRAHHVNDVRQIDIKVCFCFGSLCQSPLISFASSGHSFVGKYITKQIITSPAKVSANFSSSITSYGGLCSISISSSSSSNSGGSSSGSLSQLTWTRRGKVAQDTKLQAKRGARDGDGKHVAFNAPFSSEFMNLPMPMGSASRHLARRGELGYLATTTSSFILHGQRWLQRMLVVDLFCFFSCIQMLSFSLPPSRRANSFVFMGFPLSTLSFYLPLFGSVGSVVSFV